MSDPASKTLAENLFKALLAPSNYIGHDASVLRAFTIISASMIPMPRVTARLTITPDLCNSIGHLHGGATAMIFDCCTTCPFALVRKDGWWEMAGASRTLHVTYLNPVKEGEEIEIEGEIVAVGNRLAHCKGTMRRVKDGVIVATCDHDKANIDPPSRKTRGKSKL